MDPDASHNACGLPYQLSNFQVRVGKPLRRSNAWHTVEDTCPQASLFAIVPLLRQQGMYKCPESVLVGRPKSVADIEAIVKGFDHIQVRVTFQDELAFAHQRTPVESEPAAGGVPLGIVYF